MKKNIAFALAAVAICLPILASGASTSKEATTRALLDRLEALEARVAALEGRGQNAPEVSDAELCETDWRYATNARGKKVEREECKKLDRVK